MSFIAHDLCSPSKEIDPEGRIGLRDHPRSDDHNPEANPVGEHEFTRCKPGAPSRMTWDALSQLVFGFIGAPPHPLRSYKGRCHGASIEPPKKIGRYLQFVIRPVFA